MSLFTSMLPSHNRVEDINQKLSSDIPALAQILKAKGYNTAALVNNGQMKAHWGFDRGFSLWREYEVDTPAGTCESVTGEALTWLKTGPPEPFFLFLHYYDPHDPYDPPARYREAFGSSLTGAQAREAIWDARYPGEEMDDPELMAQVIGSYDGEIAWLDDELGKLFKALPPDTLVVIFSDHGEAFEEHGWTTHGAALYEEEVRVLLMIRPAGAAEWPAEIEEPVMLLDVAPTILSLCGIEPPLHYEGHDLTRLLEGKGLPQRVILSETKRVLEGRALKMVIRPPWKLIYFLFDGARELYRLPEEHTDLSAQAAGQGEELFELVREWVSEEDYWMIHAKGSGLFEASLEVLDGRVSVFIPVGFDMDRDRLMPSQNGDRLRWAVYPAGEVKSLFFELAPRAAQVRFDFKIDGQRRNEMVFVGTDLNPRTLPFELRDDILIRNPVVEKAFRPERDGLYLMRHRGAGPAARSATGVQLDEETIRQLRVLGYLQ